MLVVLAMEGRPPTVEAVGLEMVLLGAALLVIAFDVATAAEPIAPEGPMAPLVPGAP